MKTQKKKSAVARAISAIQNGANAPMTAVRSKKKAAKVLQLPTIPTFEKENPVAETPLPKVEKPRVVYKNLSQKTALLELTASCWTGNKKDKTVTSETEKTQHAESGSFRVWKTLLKSDQLNAVVSGFAKVRNIWTAKTLPWLGGLRIVPAEKVIETKQAIESEIRNAMDCVDAFLAEVPVILAGESTRLGAAYSPADYPSVEDLRTKFSITCRIHPVSDDFRVTGVDDSTLAEMRKNLESDIAEKMMETKRHLLRRIISGEQDGLHDGLGNGLAYLVARLKSGDSFKKNSLQNVVDAAADALGLDISGDPELAALAEKVRTQFEKIEPDSIRGKKNEAARDAVISDAEKTLREIEQAMVGLC